VAPGPGLKHKDSALNAGKAATGQMAAGYLLKCGRGAVTRGEFASLGLASKEGFHPRHCRCEDH
jgi:hypothetical protein